MLELIGIGCVLGVVIAILVPVLSVAINYREANALLASNKAKADRLKAEQAEQDD